MTRTPKAFVSLALLALLSLGTRSDAALTVSADKVEAAAGKEVTVSISLQGAKEAKGVSCMSIRLTVDPSVLTFKEVEKGPALPNALVDKSVNNEDSPGKIALGFVCGSKSPGSKEMASVEEDGVVLKVVFIVNDKASSGGKSPLKLDNYRVLDSAELPSELAVEGKDGEFTVSAGAGKWLWLVIAGAGALLLLLLILFLLSRRKKASSGPPPLRTGGPAPALPRFGPVSATFEHICVKCRGEIELPRAMMGQTFECSACGTTQVAGSGK